MFQKTFVELYRKKYLRMPTKSDMKRLSFLHEKIHGVPGMFGSLDCMHTKWKNCPMAWQGAYKGRVGAPTIVMEAVADYHCFFWHLDLGHAGTNSDVNVLQQSDLYKSFLDGRFEEVEQEAVPFKISGNEFLKMFILVDGAYPKFDRFVKQHGIPLTTAEIAFTKWQGAARKDVERAFGVLQGRWQAIARPIQLWDLTQIGFMVKCCLCLHNMCVSDRIMGGDLDAEYDPAHSVLLEEDMVIPQSQEFLDICRRERRVPEHRTGVANMCPSVACEVTREERFANLVDTTQNLILHEALVGRFSYLN
jgi:hypothetical protein